MDPIISKECIYFNPKTKKCHFIGFCEKLVKECPAVESWGLKKVDDAVNVAKESVS